MDEAGGGDFLVRLLPQTHAWAALEAVREAARRVDAKARAKMAEPDGVRTLFFLGFEVDEQLDDRLMALKHGGTSPSAALSLPVKLTGDFDRDALMARLQGGDAVYAVVPGGRQLKGKLPGKPELVVQKLAAALVPCSEQYPLPFYKLEG